MAKDFKNAAAMFIDAASDLREEPDAQNNTALNEIEPDKKMDEIKNYLAYNGFKMVRSEPRNKKIHISVTASLADRIKARSEAENKSQNELINEILEQALIFGENNS